MLTINIILSRQHINSKYFWKSHWNIQCVLKVQGRGRVMSKYKNDRAIGLIV